jgi:hypothetical protein
MTYKTFANGKDSIRSFVSGKSLANIFHDAADEFLSNTGNSNLPMKQSSWSCVAVLVSITGQNVWMHSDYYSWVRHNPDFRKANKFLRELGLPRAYSDGAPKEFSRLEVRDLSEIQQMRYAWLKTAAMIAEEEGL